MMTPQRLAKGGRHVTAAPRAERLIELIRAGSYDADIRAIARACFLRREDLTGVQMVAPDDDGSELNAEQADAGRNLTGITNTPRVNPLPTAKPKGSGLPLTDFDAMYTHFRSPNAEEIIVGHLDPVPKHTRLGPNVKVVQFKGKRYYREAIIGRVFRLPNDCTPENLVGRRLGIIGVGPDNFKLLIVDAPTNLRGGNYGKWQKKEPIYIRKNAAMAILTGEADDDI